MLACFIVMRKKLFSDFKVKRNAKGSDFGFPKYKIPQFETPNAWGLSDYHKICLVMHNGTGYICAVPKKGGEYLVIARAESPRDVYNMQYASGLSRILSREVQIESEERFRSLFENATVGIYRTTPDGKILLANPTLIKMLGYSSFEELVMRDLEKEGFEPTYPREEFKRRLEHEGKIINLETAWTKKDGSTIYVLESAKAVTDEKKQIKYYE